MSDLLREAKEQDIDMTIDKLDVTDSRDIEYIVNKYDIDILISNAGILLCFIRSKSGLKGNSFVRPVCALFLRPFIHAMACYIIVDK